MKVSNAADTRVFNVGGTSFTFSVTHLQKDRLKGTIFEEVAQQRLPDHEEFIDVDPKDFRLHVAPLIRYGLEPAWEELNSGSHSAAVTKAMLARLGIHEKKPVATIDRTEFCPSGISASYTLRTILCMKYGVNWHRYDLYSGATRLNLSMHVYELPRGNATLLRAEPAQVPIQTYPVFVKSVEGTTSTIPVISSLSVMETKALICGKSHIPPDQQHLICAGQQLRDSEKLSTYNVGPSTTIHMSIKMRGD